MPPAVRHDRNNNEVVKWKMMNSIRLADTTVFCGPKRRACTSRQCKIDETQRKRQHFAAVPNVVMLTWTVKAERLLIYWSLAVAGLRRSFQLPAEANLLGSQALLAPFVSQGGFEMSWGWLKPSSDMV